MERNFRRQSFAPVRVGDEVDVKIEAVGEKGDGIAKVKGFVLFIPNTKQGDNVKVRITRVLRKVGFAEVIGEGQARETESGSDSQESQEEESSGEESEEEVNYAEEE